MPSIQLARSSSALQRHHHQYIRRPMITKSTTLGRRWTLAPNVAAIRHVHRSIDVCRRPSLASSSSLPASSSSPKFKSFFDEVDEVMKHNSPRQFEKFIASKKSAAAWREMQHQNELDRNRDLSFTNTPVSPATSDGPSLDNINRSGEVETVDKISSSRDIWSENTSSSSSSDGSGPPSSIFSTIKHDALFSSSMDSSKSGSSNIAPLSSIFGQFDTAPTTTSTSTTQSLQEPNQNKNDSTSSIFSAISKSTSSFLDKDNNINNNLNDANGKNHSTSILLSELFPTLHKMDNKQSTSDDTNVANNAISQTALRNSKMMYDSYHFESYQQAMAAVLSEPKLERTFSKYDARTVELVKNWLLSEERIVEEEVVDERWKLMEDGLKDRWKVVGGSGNDSVEAEEGDGGEEEKDGDGNEQHNRDSQFVLKLKEQQILFQSKLMLKYPPLLEESPDKNSNETDLKDEGEQQEEKQEQQRHPSGQFKQLSQFALANLGRYCARRARSSPMEVAWYKVKESGLVLPRDTISNYLYVVSTMGVDLLGLGGSSSRGSPMASFFSFSTNEEKKEEGGEDGNDGSGKIDETQNNAFRIPEEVAIYHDLLSRPSESSISLRVKALTSKGDAKSAEELLESFKESIQSDPDSKELVRLRTYLPILKRYCETKDVSAALSLFSRMKTTPGVILEPENYIMLLATIAENGYFCNDSPPIEGAHVNGYTNSHGPELFDELATEMAGDVLEITSASARRLYNALAVGFKTHNDSNTPDALVSTLKEVHPLASMPLSTQAAPRNELVASRVMLDRSTGICPVTGVQQRLIILEPDQRKQLHDDLLALSREQYSNFLGKGGSGEKAAQELKKFADWLDEREGEPFTAIVDGANVAYYMQTFDKGRFNFHQIKFMVDTLEEMGEKPLVVIPFKYGSNEFHTSKNEVQRLDPVERQILRELTSSGKLYRVPPRCLDDYYWMLASVSDQKTSRKGLDLSVPTTDTRRWPGTRPALISNDQMRDHKYGLLEPRLFRRWYGCYMVNYNFTAFVHGECVEGNEIGFSQADFFSREIQSNESRLTDVGGMEQEDSGWGGYAWHFPVNDWDLDERFVVRIPNRKQ